MWACWNKSWTKETNKDYFSVLEWTLDAMWKGTYPEKDWRGIDFPAGTLGKDRLGSHRLMVGEQWWWHSLEICIFMPSFYS